MYKKIKNIIIAVITIGQMSFSQPLSGENTMNFLNKEIIIGEDSSIADAISILIENDIPVCMEYFAEKFILNQPDGKIKHIGKIQVHELLDKLREQNFTIKVEKESILITTPKVKKIINNPLNITLNGFSFEGTHTQFIKTMKPYFSQSFNTLNSDLAKQEYKLLFKGETSIRKILRTLTDEYGIVWSACVYPLLGLKKTIAESKGEEKIDVEPIIDEEGQMHMNLSVKFNERIIKPITK